MTKLHFLICHLLINKLNLVLTQATIITISKLQCNAGNLKNESLPKLLYL